MVRPIAKLLALLALLLMPLGMQPVAAAPADHASMEHCPEPMPAHDMKDGIVGCSMACSAALPAAELPAVLPVGSIVVSPEPQAAHDLDGLHPDTATPPPKRA